MNPVDLKPGLRFMLFDEEYQILRLSPNHLVETEQTQYRTVKQFTQEELYRNLDKGYLKFECTGKNLGSCETKMKSSFFIEYLPDSVYKEQAIFKYEVIKPLLNIRKAKRHMAVISRVEEVNSWIMNPKVIKEKLNNCSYYQSISSASVYRWIKQYLDSNGDIISLIPSYHNSGGKDKTRLDPLVQEFIHTSIDEVYQNTQRFSIQDLWLNVVYKISEYNKFSAIKLNSPSYPTIARFISKIPEYDLLSCRYGYRTAGNRFDQIGCGVEVTYPLERVEIDHTPIDVILADENGSVLGRPYLILAIDKFTRHIVGFNIGIGNNVGWAEVMICIKRIICDKSYVKELYPEIENEWNAFGIPKTIVIDNGHEFKNKAMEDAAYQIGFILQYCPPKVPQWKGSIERFFGSANTGLFHCLPGTTRSNPRELGDDENPSKAACLPFSVFLALVHKWIVDVYSQSYNKGAGGKPADLWKKYIDTFPVSWPNNISELAILLGKPYHRKITRKGIELNNLTYNNEQLYKLITKFSQDNNGAQKDFLIKYDPLDIGEVYAYDDISDNHKWIKVECTNYEYAKNLAEWEHKKMLSCAKEQFGQVNVESLARAKVAINEMIEKGVGLKKSEVARAKKVSLENEIQMRTSPKVQHKNDSTFFQSSGSSNGNISDFGYGVKVDDIIIPEALMSNKSNVTNENILNFDKSKSKTTSKNKPTNIQNIKETPLTNITFEGFGYISDLLEDNGDE